MATNFFPLPLLVANRAMCEFRSLWLAGLQPQLQLETSPDGQIRVSTNVVTEVYSVPVRPIPVLLGRVPGPLQRSRNGPSRQRRRGKRAAARAEQAAA